MLRDRAKELGITKEQGTATISELSKQSKKLRFKSTVVFLRRPDGLPGLAEEYKLSFKTTGPILHSNKYESLIREEMDLTDGYGTDSQLSKEKGRFISLEDDKAFFPNYHAVPFLNRRFERCPKVRLPLAKLAGKISTEDMKNLIKEGIKKGLHQENLNESLSAQSKLMQTVDRFLRAKGLL